MTLKGIQDLLQSNGYKVSQEKDLEYGKQLRLTNGAIVNCYDKGTINVQGKKTEEVKKLLGLGDGVEKNRPSYSTGNSSITEVFVVYGHDNEARDQLEAMLRRWNLEPLILDQLPSEGKTIIEKLENYTDRANFCVVLATPDDEGHRKGHEEEKACRARQNVVLELGMMLSQLGRDRVAILLKNQTNMERPSDIQGLIYIPFKENISEVALPLAKEMHSKGYGIDISRL